MRAADHGGSTSDPFAGELGGEVVVQGTIDDILKCKAVSHRPVPFGQARRSRRRGRGASGNGKALTVRGARENNLKNLDVTFPLGQLVAITGASGSGKSTLVNEILYKALWKRLVDTRTLPGDHDSVDGIEHVHKVVNIDQSPIGRNSRSNPATYVGFYDTIRDLFAQAPLVAASAATRSGASASTSRAADAKNARAKARSRTQLYFMPDVEVTCGVCKGARFNGETLEVTVRGKTIDDVLNMSIEEGVVVLREGAGHPQEDRGPQRPRAGVSHAGPVGDDAVGRRSAAGQDRERAEHAAALEAHRLHP